VAILDNSVTVVETATGKRNISSSLRWQKVTR